ncbi:unnamed protein product [Vitrella brassicaformis CCMP3155]|uniref:Potassium channel tetramerisation-type BTB domain-containing protein n=1 Tax=Vitrella brassicaformis (strain CCMP3155) TaxID=1169540 RepID=A0A0G4G1R2_VITBC|nr:unnamed protein product [Vitrella brassicaformis CCMP3155]|eukprot:CEM21895.1 unnamed protein product [Vitrella brassicaformis CCMP3155]
MSEMIDEATGRYSEYKAVNEFHKQVARAGEQLRNLRESIKKTEKDIHEAREKHAASDPSASSPDDVLLLNVGGTEMSVKRKHMTEGVGVEGTLLAALFAGCWDSRFIKINDNGKTTKEAPIFVDIDTGPFKFIHRAILDAATIRSATVRTANTQASVSHLLEDARRRNFTGLHDFWIKKMLSPIDSAAAGTTGDVTNPRLSATGTPDELNDFVKAADAFVKAFAAEKARLEGELVAAKRRYDNLDNEIKAVTPFLRPVNGEDPIRSVKVCGESIGTTQSTVDEMPDKLRNRFDMWSRPVEDVQPDHISRMVDHFRRKRVGASAADMAVVLTMADATEQDAFDINAFMYGLTDESPKASKAHQTFGGLGQVPSMQQRHFGFAQMSNGVQYKIVQQGSGPKPTRDQCVKVDYMGWSDDFDGQDKTFGRRGLECRVSTFVAEWLQEVFTDMRVGEVRRVILPARLSKKEEEVFIECRLLAIL